MRTAGALSRSTGTRPTTWRTDVSEKERRYGVWVQNHNSEWLGLNCGIADMRVLYDLTRDQAFRFVQRMRLVDGERFKVRMRLVDGERFKVRDEYDGVWVAVPLSEEKS